MVLVAEEGGFLMGMEDDGVALLPVDCPPSGDSVDVRMAELGFERGADRKMFTPFTAHRYYCDARDASVEAMCWIHADGPLRGSAKMVELRFAICQPIAAVDLYLSAVTDLARAFNLTVKGYGKFDSADAQRFADDTYARVGRMKDRWAKLFEDDHEEVVLRVEQAWGYFRRKHPNVFPKPLPPT
jgi:hypothetical protein